MRKALLILLVLNFCKTSSFSEADFRGELPDAQSSGMGYVGSTFTETKSVLFFNPALLAYKNNLGNGEITVVFEADDAILTTPFYFQNSFTYSSFLKSFNCGYSVNINYSLINGYNEYYNTPVDGNYNKTYDNNYNLHFDIGIGRTIYSTPKSTHSIGSDFKLMYRHDGDEIGNQFGLDVGYLFKHKSGFGTGVCINNMGNNFHGSFGNELSYDIPIPFNVEIASGFEKLFLKNNIHLITIFSEISYKHYMGRTEQVSNSEYIAVPFYKAILESNYYNKNEMNIGIFFNLFNTLQAGNGYVLTLNKINSNDIYLKEALVGFGLSFLNHINFNIAFNFLKLNYTDGTYFFEHNVPFRISFSIKNALNWNKNDFKWWKKE